MKKVYCIIVTYNGMRWIDRCISSLLLEPTPLRIVIVDNGSTDETVAYVAGKFPSAWVIQAPSNLGFGQGNNLGIRYALSKGADHIFFLNQDARVQPGSVTALVQKQVQSPRFGILSPLHLNGAGDRYYQNFFSYLSASSEQRMSDSFSVLAKEDRIIAAPFINAAAWLVSADCIRMVGGFDPLFFHYGEDRHYCHRVIHAGLMIGVATTAIIFHDREYRESSMPLSLKKMLDEEWIQFLNYTADPARKRVGLIIARRFTRHVLSIGRNLLVFNKTGIKFHVGMTKRVLGSFQRIRESRREVLAGQPFLYL